MAPPITSVARSVAMVMTLARIKNMKRPHVFRDAHPAVPVVDLLATMPSFATDTG